MPTSQTTPQAVSPRAFRGTFWIALLFFASLSSLWALSGPVFAIADESAHATKAIAQWQGQVIGYEVPGIRHTVVDLPPEDSYSSNIICFVYHPERPANCGVELGDEGTNWFNTWVGAYNPTYYFLAGWPSAVFDGSAGIYAMRIASALVGAVFLAWATQAAMAATRARWMPIGIAVLASPMIVYYTGSVNPQGLEVAAAASLWMGLLRLLQTWREPGAVLLSRTYLWVIVGISAAVVANVRALGPLWVVVIIGSCLLLSGRPAVRAMFSTGRSYWAIGAVAVAGLFSVWWTLFGGSLSHQADKSDAPLVGAGFLRGFAVMLRRTPEFIQQSAGYFGWFDAPLPLQAYVGFFVAFALLVIPALVGTTRRGAFAVAFLMIVAVFVPALVQGYSVGQTGIIWQGRYGLFLYIAIALVASMVLSSAAGSRLHYLSVRMTVVVVGLLSAFGIGAFVLVLRRYVVGNATPITQMFSNPQWQPPLGWPVLVALMVATWLAFASWLVWRAVVAARADPVAEPRASADRVSDPATVPGSPADALADAAERPVTPERVVTPER